MTRLVARDLAPRIRVNAIAVGSVATSALDDRLFTSPRTVGNHLNHIYAKLGVSTREELALLLVFEK